MQVQAKIPAPLTSTPFGSLTIEIRDRVIGRDTATNEWLGNVRHYARVEMLPGMSLTWNPRRDVRISWLEAGLVSPNCQGYLCLTVKGADLGNRLIQHMIDDRKRRLEFRAPLPEELPE